MNNISSGKFYQIDIKNLGEFRFLFHNKGKSTEPKKHHLEVYWNPENYGLVDFIVGYDVDSIEDTMADIQEDMSYFIDGARISCECRVEDGTDTDGVYTGILASYFNKDVEDDCDGDCDNCEFNEEELSDSEQEELKLIDETVNKITEVYPCPVCMEEAIIDLAFKFKEIGWSDHKAFISELNESN